VLGFGVLILIASLVISRYFKKREAAQVP